MFLQFLLWQFIIPSYRLPLNLLEIILNSCKVFRPLNDWLLDMNFFPIFLSNYL